MKTVFVKSQKIFKTLIDVMLPPVCYVCGNSCSSTYGLCDMCQEKIYKIQPPFCPRCGRRSTYENTLCPECRDKNRSIARAWSCTVYRDTIKECIHLFKYNGYIGVSDIFKDILVDFVAKNEIDKKADLVVPVPLFSTKKRERPYNHAEILARSVAKRFSIPMDAKNLKKIKWTQSQSELDKKKRMKNVKDSLLVVDKSAFSGKNVLLVDDVYTTGATLNECAKVLLEARARNVYSLTLARGE